MARQRWQERQTRRHGAHSSRPRRLPTTWPAWAKTPPLRRARILDRFKAILWERQDELAELKAQLAALQAKVDALEQRSAQREPQGRSGVEASSVSSGAAPSTAVPSTAVPSGASALAGCSILGGSAASGEGSGDRLRCRVRRRP